MRDGNIEIFIHLKNTKYETQNNVSQNETQKIIHKNIQYFTIGNSQESSMIHKLILTKIIQICFIK